MDEADQEKTSFITSQGLFCYKVMPFGLKNSYPLLCIDQLVDSIAGHQLLSFMDTFSGYNQIKMDEADQEKTSFITSQGLFCYKVIPFGLKNSYPLLCINQLVDSTTGHQLLSFMDAFSG